MPPPLPPVEGSRGRPGGDTIGGGGGVAGRRPVPYIYIHMCVLGYFSQLLHIYMFESNQRKCQVNTFWCALRQDMLPFWASQTR